jgi:hypothetical protein
VAVRFEVRLAEAQPVPQAWLSRRSLIRGRLISLHPQIMVTNDDIAQSWVVPDDPSRFGVSVQGHPSVRSECGRPR